MMKILAFLSGLLLVPTLVAVAFYSLYLYLDLPEIHVDHITKQCVRIVESDGNILSCSARKDDSKYIHVWVSHEE